MNNIPTTTAGVAIDQKSLMEFIGIGNGLRIKDINIGPISLNGNEKAVVDGMIRITIEIPDYNAIEKIEELEIQEMYNYE